jgi:two-component system chemotaxis response regulator CheY
VTGARRPILVVDDDDDIREIIVFILEKSGYEVAGAVDGLDALGQLRSGLAPALALVDLMMPRLSGADLMMTMHADPALSSIPIVVLSGDRAAGQMSADVGARDTLLKPVDIDELLTTVRRHATVEPPTVQPIHP